MIKRICEKWKKLDWENIFFLLFLFGMAIYYGWRLFALTPWYDELYTYYYFISRGPVYAALHWPLPNNHVGYSVLSAILNLFGNSAVGLRGVSWISSLISLILLFAIGKKIFPKGFALVPVFIFASMDLVNTLAVQGRGYALAACLYLLSIYELLQIVEFNLGRKRNYIILACSFVWSLYTLPSSVYFVVPLCLIGGGWLLIQRRTKEFARLFITALVSAVCTIGLYAVIWLAIGSNLLSKTEDSEFFGSGHVSIILNAPFKAAQTGIRYMLDTPYIQSVARSGYMSAFGGWIKALFENYYPGLSIPLIIIIIIGIILVIRNLVSGFIEWYMVLSFLLTPLMLIIQAALPYYRVFSFFAVPVAILITWLCVRLWNLIKKDAFMYFIGAYAATLCLRLLALPSYRWQYSDREAAIEDAYAHINLDKDDIICVTDCDQEYLVKYLFNSDNITYTPQEADYILIDNKLLLPDSIFLDLDSYVDVWKLYMTYDEVPRDYLENETGICYENERFVMYRKEK